MKKILLSSGIILTLAACSSKDKIAEVSEPIIVAPQPIAAAEPRWVREGSSEEETQQQLSRCRYDIGMNAANLESSKVLALVSDCMQKEGYRWVE